MFEFLKNYRIKKIRILNSINSRINNYFGGFQELVVLEKEYPRALIPNIQILLLEYFRNYKDALITSIRKKSYYNGVPPVDILLKDACYKNDEFNGYDECKPSYVKSVPDVIDSRLGLSIALIFFNLGKHKLLLYVQPKGRFGSEKYVLTIICKDISIANEFFISFDKYEVENSIFRGRTLTLGYSYLGEMGEATIIENQNAGWDDLILPDDTKRLIEENVFSYFNNGDILLKQGMSLRRGVLLYGQPGTGKSHACNAIARQLNGLPKYC